MKDAPISITGQVLALKEQGFAAQEIAAELKAKFGPQITVARVKAILRAGPGRTGDSRRLYEIYEMQLEMLAILRAMASEKSLVDIAKKVRQLDKKLGASDPAL